MSAAKTAMRKAGMVGMRYLAAIIVAFFLSFFLAFVLATAAAPIYPVHSVVGFIGVFLPGFMLPRKFRWLSALLLLALGSGFFSWFYVWSDPSHDPAMPRDWPRLLYLAGGAAFAVCLHWLLGRLNPQGGANGRQPVSSETNQTSAAAASRRSP